MSLVTILLHTNPRGKVLLSSTGDTHGSDNWPEEKLSKSNFQHTFSRVFSRKVRATLGSGVEGKTDLNEQLSWS